jgi:hypothetical protein
MKLRVRTPTSSVQGANPDALDEKKSAGMLALFCFTSCRKLAVQQLNSPLMRR